MDQNDHEPKASELRVLWDTLLLNFNIEICTEQLKGCTMLDLKILKLLQDNSNIKIKDIINRLKIPNSTLTNAVNRLTKKGLLERRIDNKDFRSFEIILTETGKNSIEEHITEENKLFEELIFDLNEKERAEFVQLFRKIVNRKITKP